MSGGDKTPNMEQVFPAFYHWATLGQASKEEIKQQEEDLAQKAAKAMLMMGGAPAHIQALIQEPKNTD